MNTGWIWRTVFFIAWLLAPLAGWGQYGGGIGDPNTPFLISTANHMQAIGINPNDWNKSFKLTGNIDLSGFDGVGGNPAYNIIGTSVIPFIGQFDGAGFSISNLTINATGVTDVGLFGTVGSGVRIKKGVLKNLTLINPTVMSDSGGVGSLVGILQSGEVLSCHVQGGAVSGTIIIGGLIGQSSNASISLCGVTGVVNGTDMVGGLIGQDLSEFTNSSISGCFAHTATTGSGLNAGGLIGLSEFSIITNCYSTGSVSGNGQIGGLLGRISLSAKVRQCYAACSVSGNSQVGGLIGGLTIFIPPTIKSSFWDTTVSGQSLMCGGTSTSCDNTAGRTTSLMQQASTFIDPIDPNNNWDFIGETTNGVADIWRICEGTNRPRLAWETVLPGDWSCPDGVGIEDLLVLSEQWLLENLSGDVGPGGSDGTVNFLDWGALNGSNPVSLADFSRQWLQRGATTNDIAPNGGNGFFDMIDFAKMAGNWMRGL